MKHLLLALATLCTSAATLSPAIAQGAERPPNVLFIISDDLTASALSCYGNSQCKTPHIDALAERGTRFTRAYCQYPVCGPSRASMMSGLFPESVEILSNGASAKITKNLGQRPTLGQVFMRANYFSARVSKIYHMLIPGDITRGVHGADHADSWNERYCFQAPEWSSVGEHEHLSKEKLITTDKNKHYSLGFGTAFYVVQAEGDGAEQVDVQATDKAIELLTREHAMPFFLALGLVRPHVPLVAPTSYFKPYPAPRMRLPVTPEGDWEDIPPVGIPNKTSIKFGLDSNEKKRKVLQAYYASVSFMDAQVGRILAVLDDMDLRDNTIVVFTSDHGYHLGEHEFWQKSSLHEESARIPLIIAAPGKRPAVCSSLAQLMDLYPTLAEMCGLTTPEHLQGRSLAPTLDDPEARIHEFVHCAYGRQPKVHHLIRTERHAYMAWANGTAELYDMDDDPKQFTNLAGAEDSDEVLATLKGHLKSHLEQVAQ
ncbi:MAG: iduronate-2-sulfatase [Planctomycetes bacterium]|nr:iduronate-2-sulfatase [Planctomycetota bacterium]